MDIQAFHAENLEKYNGKLTDKGIVDGVIYLTFVGGAGGNYHRRPIEGRKGLVCAEIGKNAYPIGELKFL